MPRWGRTGLTYSIFGEGINDGDLVWISENEDIATVDDTGLVMRYKDDVKEVKAGYECGLVFEGFNEIAELDQVEAYIMVEVPR